MKSRLFRNFVLIATMGFLWVNSGCGYPKVSERAYEISKALYAICNQKRDEKLTIVTNLVRESLDQNQITEDEASWFTSIVAEAENGEWESAATEVRRIMEDQVVR